MSMTQRRQNAQGKNTSEFTSKIQVIVLCIYQPADRPPPHTPAHFNSLTFLFCASRHLPRELFFPVWASPLARFFVFGRRTFACICKLRPSRLPPAERSWPGLAAPPSALDPAALAVWQTMFAPAATSTRDPRDARCGPSGGLAGPDAVRDKAACLDDADVQEVAAAWDRPGAQGAEPCGVPVPSERFSK